MAREPALSRVERLMERRIERRGLRPRDAAYMIAAFWSVAIVVFGVLERILDPKTFHSVWLGIWWAMQTVCVIWNCLQVTRIAGSGLLTSSGGADRCRR